MFKQISKLAQHSAIYAISSTIQRLAGFVFIPIYTNTTYIPSRSDFSDYVLVATFMAFMQLFYTYGMDSAMLRYFFLGKQDRKIIFSSTFSILFCSSLITTSLIILFSPEIAQGLLQNANLAHYIRLTGGILFFETLAGLPYLILRAEEKSIQFTLFRGLRFGLELAFNILFVVFLKQGVVGILYSFLAASIINLLIMLPVIIRYLTRRIDLALWKEMLKFALPLLPNAIAFMVCEMIDRIIIPYVLGKDELGLYGANHKFGTALMMLVIAFRNAWQPFFLKIAKQENARHIYARILSYFLMGATFVVLMGTFFVENILTYHYFGKFYILGKDYWEGIPMIPFFLLSYCFYGVYVVLTPGFFIKKKSQYMILFTGSAALVNVIANFVLLPKIGIWGAAFAVVIGYMVMAIMIYWISNRIYPIPIEWMRLLKIFLLLFVLMGLSYLGVLNFWSKIALSIGVVLYFFFGVLHRKERYIFNTQVAKLKFKSS